MYFDVASVVANDDFTLSLVFEDGKSGIYDVLKGGPSCISTLHRSSPMTISP